MHLSHSPTIPPHPICGKNCLPQNQSLVPEKLGTAALNGEHDKFFVMYILSKF